jgi:hypothetical protein
MAQKIFREVGTGTGNGMLLKIDPRILNAKVLFSDFKKVTKN